MQILLKPDLEKFVSEKLKAGNYTDASALINEALEVLRDQETITPEHEQYLRQEVARGIEQLDHGERCVFDANTISASERDRKQQSSKGVS